MKVSMHKMTTDTIWREFQKQQIMIYLIERFGKVQVYEVHFQWAVNIVYVFKTIGLSTESRIEAVWLILLMLQ